jgi:GAF domain-containing protein
MQQRRAGGGLAGAGIGAGDEDARWVHAPASPADTIPAAIAALAAPMRGAEENAVTARLLHMFTTHSLSGDKPEQYAQLAQQAQALVAGEHDRIANAANLSALVYHALPRLNWVGFYFFDGTELVVGPFQGLPACIRIPLDKGVCGAAARSGETQRVPDVDAFEGHVACDSASRSELVVPLFMPGRSGNDALVGVFDLDSPDLDRFDVTDQRGIEEIARIFVRSLG